MRGLEPPWAYAHTDLNRARLPIPPHPRGVRHGSHCPVAVLLTWNVAGRVRGASQQVSAVCAADWDAVCLQEITDRKSTRLNSSHANISYAVFCLKKKKN